MYNRRMVRLPKQTFRRALPAIVIAVLAYASSAQPPPDRFKQVVQPYVDAQMFMGSVLVAKNGEVIFSKSYGMADLEWSIPNSSTTRFNNCFYDEAIHRSLDLAPRGSRKIKDR